ncbi:MAG: septation protein A [Allosphingosinicella sp.]|uniref:septation protein A n=1 Tax=Allosphingosinicella sp. TaxID=2823234 RepID=UPI00393392BA
MTVEQKEAPGAGARLLIDLGPLVVFFAVNFMRGIFTATVAFMVAITIAMAISRFRYKHISPMLWFSGLMVLVLGGITLWLQDETFIKMKPTMVYAAIGAVLLFGLLTSRNLLQLVLGSAYPGLSETGWRKLTRNWIGFFLAMAVVNEAVWRTTSTDFWVGFKLWFFLPVTFLFALANIPMLMRHGLMLEPSKDEPPIPPTQ